MGTTTFTSYPWTEWSGWVEHAGRIHEMKRFLFCGDCKYIVRAGSPLPLLYSPTSCPCLHLHHNRHQHEPLSALQYRTLIGPEDQRLNQKTAAAEKFTSHSPDCFLCSPAEAVLVIYFSARFIEDLLLVCSSLGFATCSLEAIMGKQSEEPDWQTALETWNGQYVLGIRQRNLTGSVRILNYFIWINHNAWLMKAVTFDVTSNVKNIVISITNENHHI